MIKLVIEDCGDSTVGLFPCSFTIDTPFLVEDLYENYEEMKQFKEDIEKIYKDFFIGYVVFTWLNVERTIFGETSLLYDFETRKPNICVEDYLPS